LFHTHVTGNEPKENQGHTNHLQIAVNGVERRLRLHVGAFVQFATTSLTTKSQRLMTHQP
jgi:hypothetical protein